MPERQRLYSIHTDLRDGDNRARLIAEGILPPLPDNNQDYFHAELTRQGLKLANTIQVGQIHAIPGHQAGSMKGGLSAHIFEDGLTILTSKNPMHLEAIPNEIETYSLRDTMEKAVTGTSRENIVNVAIYKGTNTQGFHFEHNSIAVIVKKDEISNVIIEANNGRGHTSAKIVTLHSPDKSSV